MVDGDFHVQNARGQVGEERAKLWLSGVDFRNVGSYVSAVKNGKIDRHGSVANWVSVPGYNSNKDFEVCYPGADSPERHEIKTDFRAYAKTYHAGTKSAPDGYMQPHTARLCVEIDAGCIGNMGNLREMSKQEKNKRFLCSDRNIICEYGRGFQIKSGWIITKK